MTSRVLVSLRVKAEPERAFEVFTREVAAWWQPQSRVRFTPRPPGRLAFEPRVGGRFTEAWDDGKVFEIGRVLAWEPGVRLLFTWRQASFAAGQTTEVEVTFEPIGPETRVTIEPRGWDSVPQAHVARHTMPEAIFMRRHAEWWQALLGRFATAARG